MAEPDYFIVNSSEVEDDEKAQHDTPTRKALRKAGRVFAGKIPRKELFSKYGVSERRVLDIEHLQPNLLTADI